jgi:hypothetical protein
MCSFGLFRIEEYRRHGYVWMVPHVPSSIAGESEDVPLIGECIASVVSGFLDDTPVCIHQVLFTGCISESNKRHGSILFSLLHRSPRDAQGIRSHRPALLARHDPVQVCQSLVTLGKGRTEARGAVARAEGDDTPPGVTVCMVPGSSAPTHSVPITDAIPMMT